MDKRNADYLEITRRLQFPIDAPILSPMGEEEEEQLVSVSASIFESDVLIWLVGPHYDPSYLFPTNGLSREVCFMRTFSLYVLTPPKDLNYRIELPDPEVRELIGDSLLPHNRDALLEYDQVRRIVATKFRPHPQPSSTSRSKVGNLLHSSKKA